MQFIRYAWSLKLVTPHCCWARSVVTMCRDDVVLPRDSPLTNTIPKSNPNPNPEHTQEGGKKGEWMIL